MSSSKPNPTRPEDYRFADSAEIMKRTAQLDRFADKMFEPELRPWFVSDDANIFDISGDLSQEIIEKIRVHYAQELTEEQLRMPVWRLLDLLEPSGSMS